MVDGYDPLQRSNTWSLFTLLFFIKHSNKTGTLGHYLLYQPVFVQLIANEFTKSKKIQMVVFKGLKTIYHQKLS